MPCGRSVEGRQWKVTSDAIDAALDDGDLPSAVRLMLIDLRSYLSGESGSVLTWPGAVDCLAETLETVERFAA